MSKYKIARRKVANTIIHVNSYYIILRLVEWELANSELSLKEKVQIKLAYIESKDFFIVDEVIDPQ